MQLKLAFQSANLRRQFTQITRRRKFYSNALYAFASTFVVSIVGFISSPLIAAQLSRDDIGILRYATGIIVLVASLSSPGVASAISYSVARGYEGEYELGTKFRIRIYRRSGLILLPIAFWYCWIDPQYQLAITLLVGALLLPYAFALDTSEYYLIGRSDFKSLFWRRAAAAIIVAVIGNLVALVLPYAYPVYISRLLASAILFYYIFHILLKKVSNQYHDPTFWEKAKDFSLISRLTTVGNHIDVLILGSSGNLTALAVYSIAKSVNLPFETAARAVYNLIYKRMSRKLHRKFRRLWVVFSVIMLMVGIPCIMAGWIGLTPFLLKLYPKYPELLFYLPLLTITSLVATANILPLGHALFHNYDLWNKQNVRRQLFRIPMIVLAVLIVDAWGAIFVQLIFNITDYLVYTYASWNER